MRNRTKFSPSLGSLESRELLSSLPIVPSPTTIPVEKGTGKGSSGTGGSPIGTLQGTVSIVYSGNLYGLPATTVAQVGGFTTCTGKVKPFGRVTLAPPLGGSILGPEFQAPSPLPSLPPPTDNSPLPSSPEGPIKGTLYLTKISRGGIETPASITLNGASWAQFAFKESRGDFVSIGGRGLGFKSQGVIASGTGTLTFPEGDPVLTFNSSTGSGPPVTVPFTITLRGEFRRSHPAP
jgi:hypothetical protein